MKGPFLEATISAYQCEKLQIYESLSGGPDNDQEIHCGFEPDEGPAIFIVWLKLSDVAFLIFQPKPASCRL